MLVQQNDMNDEWMKEHKTRIKGVILVQVVR